LNSEAGSRGGEVERALSQVEELYTGNLAEYGLEARAVGWSDPQSQLLRFKRLAYAIEADPPETSIRVNDWGCGYGAMFEFLDRQPGFDLASYRGYDISPQMVEAARENVRDPRAEFVVGTQIDQDADYTFVSGTFNVHREASEDAWAKFVKQTLIEIGRRSHRGFAFNLLTTHVDWRKDDLFYGDPTEYFDFCRRQISEYVSLLHDYPLFEWTIAVLHGPSRSRR
jgi:SAM-dependent methyltransferase